MAGQPGKSGGARKNAGRPKKEPQDRQEKLTIATNGKQTPLEFLLSVMNDNEIEDRLRIDAAKTAAQYVHPKIGEGGKKEKTAEEAKKVAGRFSQSAPPKLVAAGGKKV